MHTSWVQAMKKELKALEDNKIWSVTELPLGKTAIRCIKLNTRKMTLLNVTKPAW